MQSSSSYPEIKEGLIQLASILKAEDLEDAEILSPLLQILSIVDPEPSPLPKELVDELAQIDSKQDRFEQAAMMLGTFDVKGLKALAESMKASGLLAKSDPYKSDEDLAKMGAMARLAPFNPLKDVQAEDKGAMRSWQTYGQDGPEAGSGQDPRDIRSGLSAMHPNAKIRALHALSAQTPSRQAKGGGREFLLHRGMSAEEFAAYHVPGKKSGWISHSDTKSSWSPDLQGAKRFKDPLWSTNDDENHPLADEMNDLTEGRSVSAWIHEKHIHHVPRTYGAMDGENARSGGENEYAREHEVIVSAGHKSPIASTKDIPARERFADPKRAPANIHGRINRNAAALTPGNPVVKPEARKFYADKMKERLRNRLDVKKSDQDPHTDLQHAEDFRAALKHADSQDSVLKSDLAKALASPTVRAVADSYAKSRGFKLDHGVPNHQIDPAHSAKIAQAYAEMKHDPEDPEVKSAYGALVSETTDQFKHLMSNGLKLSRIKPGMDNPYKGGSKDLIHDVHTNNHMWYYPTEGGFGSGEANADHPLLAPTDQTHDGHKLLANDLFRVVHDYFGHAKEGHSFGPRGEDNAWKNHMQMYSPEAQKALTSETRGQNSWVNFGPHGEHNRKNPAQTIFAEQKAGLLPGWVSHHSDETKEQEAMKKARKLIDDLRKSGRTKAADGMEAMLEKGQDENGNPIRGSNKRLQQAKTFGKPSDAKVDAKGVAHPKIPDANGARTSPQRMKMMNAIKGYAKKTMGANMVIAEGKRDESGKLKAKAGIEKQPFDVFSAKGHKEEKARSAKIGAINDAKPKGEKPIKRVDPKPDHRSGNLETQPSPDAAVHEIAHEHLAPMGMNIKEHQTFMDKRWGQSQKDYGHMQQKKTAGEVQPMAAENPIRREIGLPANKTGQKVKDASKPVEQTVDGTGPRFHRAKDSKGAPTDLMRQSRLLHPENKERVDMIRDGRLKHDPAKGLVPGTSVNAKINTRAAEASKKPADNVVAMPKKAPKPEKLAASELGKTQEWSVHRADKNDDDSLDWSHVATHSDETSASKHARQLYQNGVYSVKVQGPDGKESDAWASSKFAKAEVAHESLLDRIEKSLNRIKK